MDTGERSERGNSGVVIVNWPLSEEDIQTAKQALAESKKVRWKHAWGASSVSEEDLNNQTSQTIRLLLRRGIGMNTPGIHWVDLSNPSKYDHDACLAAARQGDRILNYDGTDHTSNILTIERQRRGAAHDTEFSLSSDQDKDSAYDQITQELIEMMRNGLSPWEQPWTYSPVLRPRSAHGRRYEGLNAFYLAWKAKTKGYESDRWFTTDRAQKEGRPVRQGEQGTVVMSAWYVSDDNYGDLESSLPFRIKPYMVFNWDQLEGVEKEERKQTKSVLPGAQSVIDKYLSKERQRRLKLEFQHSDSHDAYYVPWEDLIIVPHPDRFPDLSLYYLTVFHEIAHSTGHPKRLDRKDGKRSAPFGSYEYGQEELVAQMTAAFLAAETNLLDKGPVMENSAAYLRDWGHKVEERAWGHRIDEDLSILYKAGQQAKKAVDYVLKGKRPPKRTRRRNRSGSSRK